MAITCRKIEDTEKDGAYEGIIFKKEGSKILKLKIAFPAVKNESSGLKNIDIYEWLREVGISIVNEIEEYKTVTFYDGDVIDEKLVIDWEARVDI